MPTAPKLTTEQRTRALADAAEARALRATARAELKAGELSLADFLTRAETDPRLAAMRVSALVSALPGYGEARSTALLAELGIAQSRRIRGLGPRQRESLLTRLTDRAQSRS